MFDDDPRSEPFHIDDDYEEPSRSPRARSCLFLFITSLLIISLAGSSILAYFLINRASRSSTTGLEDTFANEEAANSPPPTAAPATVAALSNAGIAESNELDSPPVSLEVNRIAIINGDSQVETMTSAGEDRRLLTFSSDNLSFQFPAWAPDGQHVAVVGNGLTGGAIYILEDVAGTGEIGGSQVYTSNDKRPFYLFWSPDSQNLGFLANHPRNTVSLNVVSGDGSVDSRLLATGSPFYWDWSRNGRQLLIHSGGNQLNNTISLINLDGEDQTGSLARPGNFQAPGIGHDGRYWAFAEESDDGLSSLVVVDALSGQRQSYEQAGSLALSWSPVQDLVAFTNGGSDQHLYWGPLRLLDVNTGDVRLLTSQTVLAFFWSPDGRSIAYITLGRNEEDSEAYAASIKNHRISRVGAVPIQQFGTGFLTLSVIDVVTGQGLRLLDFAPTAAYLTQFLPYFDQYALSHRVWSPDSRALVLPVGEEDGNVILVVPIGGGRPYRVAAGEIAFWSPR